ncbi:energy transducer TonB [Paraglaciecola sp. 20A4]|uniref:energy transducer TonB n=1 Tax=Paraglaciecola sp. 20A4 TaxID=2687288 RepID=UPI00140AD27F|nr:energy transducer TonB [Paraglaciecola sp. 20A4]
MNKLLLVVVGGFLVGGCATVPKQSTLTALDLTADKAAVNNYWITYRKVAPEYPQQAKNDKISGCVEFSLLIDVNGRAVEPTIIKAFPEGVFDKQADNAIRKWLWVPTKTNTERQPVLTTIQQDFVVRNSQNAKAAYDACKI